MVNHRVPDTLCVIDFRQAPIFEGAYSSDIISFVSRKRKGQMQDIKSQLPYPSDKIVQE
jgi:hypothetical protein